MNEELTSECQVMPIAASTYALGDTVRFQQLHMRDGMFDGVDYYNIKLPTGEELEFDCVGFAKLRDWLNSIEISQ